MSLVEHLLLKVLSPVEHNLLQFLELLVESIAKIIDFILPFLAVLPDLPMMDLISQLFLPGCNMRFQNPDLLHECLKLDVGLNLQTIVGHELQSFLDEREDLDLLIGAEATVFVLVEHAHELLDRADLGEGGEVLLELLEDHLDHILGHVGASDVILGDRCPYFHALRRAPDVGIRLALYFVYYRRVDGVQRVQRLRVELDCR